MSAEDAAAWFEELRDELPAAAQIARGAASEAFKLRRQYLQRQPRAKQAEWVRRALARPGNASAAEEVLASYFLEVHEDLVKELLDLFEIKHEDGRLEEADPAQPAKQQLITALEKFRSGEEGGLRELLLCAVAAQSAIDWPDLEELLDP
ncbi:MAG: hypothetical protein VX614_08310 [Myxococcota bacterium]|nr:hypothetical protein [Myxococcota bacterium]